MRFKERGIGWMSHVKTFQWKNYTHGGLTELRIGVPQIEVEDLIIFWASADIAPNTGNSRILREVRGWERPSDHVPVFATINL